MPAAGQSFRDPFDVHFSASEPRRISCSYVDDTHWLHGSRTEAVEQDQLVAKLEKAENCNCLRIGNVSLRSMGVIQAL
jgi:hypothetical protein